MAAKRTSPPVSYSNNKRSKSDIFLTVDERHYHVSHEALFKLVGGLCSKCGTRTYTEDDGTPFGQPVILRQNLLGGQRTPYYEDMIWLCPVCHTKAKTEDVSTDDLIKWKEAGEEKARNNMHPNEQEEYESLVIAQASAPAVMDIRKAKATLLKLHNGDLDAAERAKLVRDALDSVKFVHFCEERYSFQTAYEMLLLLETMVVKIESKHELEDVIIMVLEKCIQTVARFINEISAMQAIGNIVKRMKDVFEGNPSDSLPLVCEFMKCIHERKRFTLKKDDNNVLVGRLEELADRCRTVCRTANELMIVPESTSIKPSTSSAGEVPEIHGGLGDPLYRKHMSDLDLYLSEFF